MVNSRTVLTGFFGRSASRFAPAPFLFLIPLRFGRGPVARVGRRNVGFFDVGRGPLLSLVLDADLASDKALDAELLASLALDAELVVSLALDAGSSSPCVALELADADLVLRFSRYKSRVGAFVCFFLPDAV